MYCIVYIYIYICLCVHLLFTFLSFTLLPYIYIYMVKVWIYICIYIYGKSVKDRNMNSKCTHRQMTRLWLEKDRPGFSSERAPHRDKTTNSRPKHLKRKQYLVKRPQSGLDTKTYWLTVSRKMTPTLSTSYKSIDSSGRFHCKLDIINRLINGI
jgi:hypothetical protein